MVKIDLNQTTLKHMEAVEKQDIESKTSQLLIKRKTKLIC